MVLHLTGDQASDVSGDFDIVATYCDPDDGPGKVLQILTHGLSFDRSYWDYPAQNGKYSYVVQAVDNHGYSTLAYDRLGVGESSKGDSITQLQMGLEVATLHRLTVLASSGHIPGISQGFSDIVHVGHLLSSSVTYNFANQYPGLTKGIVLTGFSQIPSFAAYFAIGGQFVPVTQIPSAAVRYPPGYLSVGAVGGLHTNFFAPGDFDPDILEYAFAHGQPSTPGELITIEDGTDVVSNFSGPVYIITGGESFRSRLIVERQIDRNAERDIPFCGGNCYGTQVINGTAPDLLVASQRFFPEASQLNTTVLPAAGHGLNLAYKFQMTYDLIFRFLQSAI